MAKSHAGPRVAIAVAFIAALMTSGCKSSQTNQDAASQTTPSQQSAAAHAKETERELAEARKRLEAVEMKITTIRNNVRRFLRKYPIDEGEFPGPSEAALQIQRLVFEQKELQKVYDSLSKTHKELTTKLDTSVFDPTDSERTLVEDTQEIRELDRELRGLRLEEAALLVDHQEDDVAVRKVRRKLDLLEKERQAEFDKQFRDLFNAKLEQSALGMQILQEQIDKVDHELASWMRLRQEAFRMLEEYETLKRNLETAEAERTLIQQQIADLIEKQKKEAK